MAGNPFPLLRPSVSCSPWTAVTGLTRVSLHASPPGEGHGTQQNLSCNSTHAVPSGVQRTGQGDRERSCPSKSG